MSWLKMNAKSQFHNLDRGNVMSELFSVSETKHIKLVPKDLPRLVHEKVQWLEENYGPRFRPVRILFGPEEYLLLREFVRDNAFYSDAISLRYPDTFKGYPVGLKMSNGIEMELNVENVMTLAKGTVTVP